MAVTGETVFLMAIKLLDGIERDGTINESDIVTYRAKAPSIITLLQGELLPSITLLPGALLPTPTAVVDYTDLNTPLSITDKQALYVLPYGLAAELIISEDDDDDMGAYFSKRYQELKMKHPAPAVITKITNVYGKFRR
jgi:hypothetical protein